MDRHIKTTVPNICGYSVDVSTIDVSQHGIPGLVGIETALFFTWADGQEASEVIATYATWDEAKEAHTSFCNPAVLARIVSYFAHYHNWIVQNCMSNAIGSNPEWNKK
jgi:hypothetical protein